MRAKEFVHAQVSTTSFQPHHVRFYKVSNVVFKKMGLERFTIRAGGGEWSGIVIMS